MVTVKETNLEMLRLVAARLRPLRDQLVFLGGCTTALFLSDAGHQMFVQPEMWI